MGTMLRSAVLMAMMALLVAGAGPAPFARAQGVPLHRCDELAANPLDPDHKGAGVAAENLQGGPARDACTEAVSQYPNELRFQFQLARDRKSTRLNSSHIQKSRMPSSA